MVCYWVTFTFTSTFIEITYFGFCLFCVEDWDLVILDVIYFIFL